MTGGSSTDHVDPERVTAFAPPTASQFVTDEQLNEKYGGFTDGAEGMVPWLQVAPLRMASMATLPPLSSSLPIATQLVPLKHVTAESSEPVDGGVESCETVVDPLEICITIPTGSDPSASVARFHVPTTSHSDGPQHEIPLGPRLRPVDGATSFELHSPPLKVSMRASPLDSSPTAVQSVGSAQETDDIVAWVPAVKGSPISPQTPPLSTSAIGSWGKP
jgi:hypothetical protein